MKQYPLHEKLRANEGTAITLSGFLDWLSDQDFVIAEYHDERLLSTRLRYEDLIGGYLGIDPKALQAEKEEMYKEIRESSR